MFDNYDDEIEYDYKRILEDSDDLYEDEEYNDDEYDYDYQNEREYDCYYHTLANELID